jgi:hypothetical protein
MGSLLRRVLPARIGTSYKPFRRPTLIENSLNKIPPNAFRVLGEQALGPLISLWLFE